jgi:hypothetical protein
MILQLPIQFNFSAPKLKSRHAGVSKLESSLYAAVAREWEIRSYFTTGGLPQIRIFFFQLNTWGHSPYVTSSLKRRWICRLQLLLFLASAFILRSESRRTHDHILLSQIRGSRKLEPRSPYLYPPGTGWPSYTPGTGFPFRRLLRLAGLWWR